MQAKTRKEREREQKRGEILDAAQELFSEKGFHGATMAEISQVSEFPLGTIYKFFPGKEQLYHDLVVERGHAYGRVLNRILRDEALTSGEKLSRMLEDIADFFIRNKAFIRLYIAQVIHLEGGLIPELGSNISRMHEEMIGLYAGLIADCINDGVIIKGASSREIAQLFNGMITSTVWAWIQEEEPEDRLIERLRTVHAILVKKTSDDGQKQ